MSDIPMHVPTMAGLLVMGDTIDIAKFLNEFSRQFQSLWSRSWLGPDGGICKVVDSLDGNGKWLVDNLESFLSRRLEIEKQKATLEPKP